MAGFAYRNVHRVQDCGLIALCLTNTKALVQILYFLIKKFVKDH